MADTSIKDRILNALKWFIPRFLGEDVDDSELQAILNNTTDSDVYATAADVGMKRNLTTSNKTTIVDAINSVDDKANQLSSSVNTLIEDLGDKSTTSANANGTAFERINQVKNTADSDYYVVGTQAQSGVNHGRGDYGLRCQYSRDNDGFFKLYIDGGGHRTKTDCSSESGTLKDSSGSYTASSITKYCKPKYIELNATFDSDKTYRYTFDHDVQVLAVYGISGHFSLDLRFGRTSGHRQWSVYGTTGTIALDIVYVDL